MLKKKGNDMKRSFIREILEHTTNETISFAGGLPDSTLFPHLALKEAANNALNNPHALQYSTSTGYEPLKQKIAKQYTQEGFPTTSDEILITSGSQQALDIISRFYHDRDITIEAPSYLGAMNVFTLNHLTCDSVALEDDGVDIENFKKSFSNTKFTYLIPDFQNPSGCTLSIEKRREIAKIIQDMDGIMIEDSPYSKLYFEEEMPSISTLIPKQSFHLGSFSKTLAPALRIGWIRADKKLLQPLIAYKEAMDLHTNGLVQHILDAYLEEGNHYKNHLDILRNAYHDKMEFFVQMLDELLPSFIYAKPKGGMFIYGRFTDINTSVLVQKCLEKEVLFVPGAEFYTHEKVNNEIRFNFTNASREEIKKGLMIIQSVISHQPPLSP